MQKDNHYLTPKALFSVCILQCISHFAYAHVEYYDLNQGVQIADLTAAGKNISQSQYGATAPQDLALANPAYWNSTYQTSTIAGTFSNISYTAQSGGATVLVDDATDFGWGAGTQTSLGDSHKVDFFNFRLQQESVVNISWAVSTTNATAIFLDSGFSLYSGLLPYQAHDDTQTDPLNPVEYINYTPVQNQPDIGNALDAQGNVSPFRDTLQTDTSPYTGQFNALGGWSMANFNGNWSALKFLQAVDNKHVAYSSDSNDAMETLSITLAAGNYSIAASGALLPGVSSFGLTDLHGQLEFSYASAVPLPAALWLYGPSLLFLGSSSRLKQRQTA